MSARPAHETSFDALVAAFVQQAKRLPQVREILVERVEDADRIWTVIDAEPFDRSARAPVYAVELAALDAAGTPDVAFRLVNRREYAQCDLGGIVPTDAAVVWSRERVADRA